jgi:hypothetical protein
LKERKGRDRKEIVNQDKLENKLNANESNAND